MAIEIRKVPPNWEHPKDKNGKYIPLYGISYKEAAQKWIDGFSSFKPDKFCNYYWEYSNTPLEEEHVEYNKDEATWYQVYSIISEGVPISPPFETKEELIAHIYSDTCSQEYADYIKELLSVII